MLASAGTSVDGRRATSSAGTYAAVTTLEPRPVQLVRPAPCPDTQLAGDVALREAFVLTGAPVRDVWIDYAAIGGDQTLDAVTRYAAGQGRLPPMELLILAHALLERLREANAQT